jgi:DNA-binding MarR family transcriptional regulator
VFDKKQYIENIVQLHRQINTICMFYKPEPWMKVNLTIDQLKSLIIIEHRQKTSFKELAEALNITQSNVTGIADRLIKNGLVKRIPNPVDRRMQFLVLTKRAAELLGNLKQTILSEETEILERMKEEHLAALLEGLSALAEAADTYAAEHNNRVEMRTTISHS